ncbi:Conserved hypothetical protein [Yarrowia lipolytica]|nr:Conserved hypothetical protein [Yarrowia lipolytica]
MSAAKKLDTKKKEEKDMNNLVRSSASLLVYAKPTNQVLFLKRPGKGSFPASHVFPGGALDAKDPCLEYCAIRETHEETGLLCCDKPFVEKKELFEPVWKKLGLTKPYAHLLPVSNWTTPPTGVTNKRFINHLYICPVSSTFVHDVQMPSEAAIKSGEFNKGALEWLGPKEALDKFETGEIVLYPPQYYLLKALVENNCEEKKVSEILGMRKFEPVVIESLPAPEGHKKLVMDWGRGERGIITFKKGVPIKIEHLRDVPKL